jgi:hemoglobin
MKKDIETEDDIRQLVDTFYEKVNIDELLSPVFNQHSDVNWPLHLSKMYQFWSTQLIGPVTYKGQPFPPHTKLSLSQDHFRRWLELFIDTVNEMFDGAIADLAVYKARNIAQVFQYKLGIIK